MSKYLSTFLMAGATVTGIEYLGNAVNPLLGGILSGIPISIPSMLLITNLASQKKFIFSASIMVALLAVVTVMCWFLYVKMGMKNTHAVIISTVVWTIGGLIYYFMVVKK
jgi:hypothetical protein